VVTLFHEFGHLIHHVLGGHQRWARFAGVATEWDFVEAPSQLLEEWAWDATVLEDFATDEDGTPIPAELVARMRDAEDFGKGLDARTQMFYAALSYRMHQEPPADGPAISALSRRLQEDYSMITPLPDTHFHAAFGHLDGYSSGYYTYMWSLVIAKDLFSVFDRDNLYDAEIAARYRDRVLAQGGRKDAADLVEDFLGRPFGFESFATWLEE
jgi:thimet oligopeptidase